MENSDTTGCAFLATGFRTVGAGAVMETVLVAGTGEGLIGDNSDGMTASSDAFPFRPMFVSMTL